MFTAIASVVFPAFFAGIDVVHSRMIPGANSARPLTRKGTGNNVAFRSPQGFRLERSPIRCRRNLRGAEGDSTEPQGFRLETSPIRCRQSLHGAEGDSTEPPARCRLMLPGNANGVEKADASKSLGADAPKAGSELASVLPDVSRLTLMFPLQNSVTRPVINEYLDIGTIANLCLVNCDLNKCLDGRTLRTLGQRLSGSAPKSTDAWDEGDIQQLLQNDRDYSLRQVNVFNVNGHTEDQCLLQLRVLAEYGSRLRSGVVVRTPGMGVIERAAPVEFEGEDILTKWSKLWLLGKPVVVVGKGWNVWASFDSVEDLLAAIKYVDCAKRGKGSKFVLSFFSETEQDDLKFFFCPDRAEWRDDGSGFQRALRWREEENHEGILQFRDQLRKFLDSVVFVSFVPNLAHLTSLDLSSMCLPFVSAEPERDRLYYTLRDDSWHREVQTELVQSVRRLPFRPRSVYQDESEIERQIEGEMI